MMPSAGTRSADTIADSIRRTIITQSGRAHVGHVGSALSVADILAALFAGPLAGVRAEHPDRHRFVLSKGHAALSLYGAMHATGQLTDEELDAYCADGSPLAGHPEHVHPCIDFSTGSLGHGLPLATGAALAARLQGSARCAFVLMSDAELDEGSVWEAALFAGHHRLANLIAIVDVNGQQALGYTEDVLSLEPLADKWRSFGWNVHDVDGHNLAELGATLESLDVAAGRPHVLLARTVFAKGVSFMERRIEWHYLPMSDNEHRLALAEVGGNSG